MPRNCDRVLNRVLRFQLQSAERRSAEDLQSAVGGPHVSRQLPTHFRTSDTTSHLRNVRSDCTLIKSGIYLWGGLKVHDGTGNRSICDSARVLHDMSRLGSVRRPLGASTIIEQVVKNILIDNRITNALKIRKAILALRAQRLLCKDEILAPYPNEMCGSCEVGVPRPLIAHLGHASTEWSIFHAERTLKRLWI